ncbi:hypothetical protein FACS1894166_01180 [Bacilli bacterium]|nr:hypothetical protein FACS1894166_01180 [Bacilli bacterium]
MKKLTTLKFLVPLAIVGATSASIIPFTTSCSVAIHKDFQWSDETQIKAELMNKDSDFVKKASEDLNKNYDPTKTSPTDAKMLADVNESLTFNSWCYVMVSALYNYIITDDDSRTSGADTIKLRVEMKDNKLTHNTVAS